jgi:hypothetical protein
VPRRSDNTRMNLALEWLLRFRGRRVAVLRGTRRGAQAVRATVLSGQGAGCVSRQRLGNYKVPRSRASSGRQPRGLARPGLSSGSSVRVGAVCRCRRGLAVRSMHLNLLVSFKTKPSLAPCLYGSVPAAYGWHTMRQPNYAFERTVMWRRNVRRHRAAAQRER